LATVSLVIVKFGKVKYSTNLPYHPWFQNPQNAQKLFSQYFCFWRFQPQYWQMVQVNKIASKGIQENSSGSLSKDISSHIYEQFRPSVNFTNIL
jgi:hypothetical protein